MVQTGNRISADLKTFHEKSTQWLESSNSIGERQPGEKQSDNDNVKQPKETRYSQKIHLGQKRSVIKAIKSLRDEYEPTVREIERL